MRDKSRRFSALIFSNLGPISKGNIANLLSILVAHPKKNYLIKVVAKTKLLS